MKFDYKPIYSLTPEMLDLVSQIMEALGQISGVGDLSKQPNLRRINRLRSIHSSTAIEGNTLTFEQVVSVINGKTVLAPRDEIQEIKQTFEAYKLLEEINPFDVKDMLRVHGVMMLALCDEAGKFRSKGVGVFDSDGRAVHVAPQPGNVSPLIHKLFDWLETEKVHDLIKSSIYHYEFEAIHPFNDGNGRMGRFWQSALLAKWKPIFAWIPIETVIRERQEEYYKAFIAVQNEGGNCNPFILFMLNAILQAVKNIEADSEKFLRSQTSQIQKLMAIFENEHEPLSAKDIADKLGLKSLAGLKRSYIEPALKLGLISMSNPDKPTSKHQRYRKTY